MSHGETPVPKEHDSPDAHASVLQTIEQAIGGISSLSELDEIEVFVREAKDRMKKGQEIYWSGKIPCWELSRCPEQVRLECPAYQYAYLPCWEIEGTFCKLYENGTKGDGTAICNGCRVYKKYGHREPILIHLLGKGFTT